MRERTMQIANVRYLTPTRNDGWTLASYYGDLYECRASTTLASSSQILVLRCGDWMKKYKLLAQRVFRTSTAENAVFMVVVN